MMRISWARLPRLIASAPQNLGPSQPEATAGVRGTYRQKTFAVQGPRRAVDLTEREWELLSLLFEYRGAYLTRETVLSRVWGPYYVGNAKLYSDTVRSLRAAMRRAGYPRDLIREEAGIGVGIPELNGEALKRRQV